jgi:predicted CoA-binding protein
MRRRWTSVVCGGRGSSASTRAAACASVRPVPVRMLPISGGTSLPQMPVSQPGAAFVVAVELVVARADIASSVAAERARDGTRCDEDDSGQTEGMRHDSTPEVIRDVLTTTKTWAIVGLSPNPARDSHRVATLLQERGFRIIPVNPGETEILGERCYPDVPAIPASEGVEVVDIFRRSELAGEHVDEAIAVGAKAVWLQLGVIDGAAASRAAEAGLAVVMDKCPAIELPRLAV